MATDLPKIQKGPDDFVNHVRPITALAEDPVTLRTVTSKSVNAKATFMGKDANWMARLSPSPSALRLPLLSLYCLLHFVCVFGGTSK